MHSHTMIEIELEKTYLAKKLPEGLEHCEHKEITDLYVPVQVDHPVLRIRRKGEKCEITKKQPIHGIDSSEQAEHTIQLSEAEYQALSLVESKSVRKIRYDYLFGGVKAEVDIFKDGLEGLVLVDVEFADVATKDAFEIPDFCLVDVTQDKVFAGGMLCGRTYADIEAHLKKLGYTHIHQK